MDARKLKWMLGLSKPDKHCDVEVLRPQHHQIFKGPIQLIKVYGTQTEFRWYWLAIPSRNGKWIKIDGFPKDILLPNKDILVQSLKVDRKRGLWLFRGDLELVIYPSQLGQLDSRKVIGL